MIAIYARLALDAGARIIGGCCGTTPEHIHAMRQALEAHERGAPPDVETVVAALGEVSNGARAVPRRAGPAGRRRAGRQHGAPDQPAAPESRVAAPRTIRSAPREGIRTRARNQPKRVRVPRYTSHHC